MGHSDGLCSMYLDSNLDLLKAKNCLFDAKTDYVSACNSLDTLLVHQSIIEKVGPIITELIDSKQVEVRADAKLFPYIQPKHTTNLLKVE